MRAARVMHFDLASRPRRRGVLGGQWRSVMAQHSTVNGLTKKLKRPYRGLRDRFCRAY